MRRTRRPGAVYVRVAMRGRRLIGAVLACGAFAAPAQADVGVSVGNNAFSPQTVTITEGEVVTWTWTGPDTNHSVTSDATNDQRGSFDSDPGVDSPNHPVGFKFSHSFEFAGTYTYFDKANPSIRGTVVVRERVNDSTPPPPDLSPPSIRQRRLSLSKRRFTFRLNEPARVTARLRGPTRRTRIFNGRVGRNTVRLPRRMRRGRYSLRITAVDASNNVRRYTLRFRVR
jgi:plastocyanin